jgi:hypothetical protein
MKPEELGKKSNKKLIRKQSLFSEKKIWKKESKRDAILQRIIIYCVP